MLMKSIIRRLPSEEVAYVRHGGILTGMVTGLFAYLHYRQYVTKSFLRSEGHYKFSQQVTNCTPWKQMYFTWYRMPEEEWSVYHRFKPYYIIGQLDHSKEILIPETKLIGGKKCAGFAVINPLYCYEGARINFKNAFDGKDPVDVKRSAVIVKRGWIPAHLRDKRSRPNEINTLELTKVVGTWRRGQDIHQYTKPNNHNNNEWNNLSLEDIGKYWDIANFDEAKYYYF